MYYPPGRILLVIAGLFLVIFGLIAIGSATTIIAEISYSDIPLMGLPDRLPNNVSWMGHYWLSFFVGICTTVLGIFALIYRQNTFKMKFLLVAAVSCFVLYAAFVILSGYHEAFFRGGMLFLPLTFISLVMCNIGAALNFSALTKHNRQAQA